MTDKLINYLKYPYFTFLWFDIYCYKGSYAEYDFTNLTSTPFGEGRLFRYSINLNSFVIDINIWKNIRRYTPYRGLYE